MRWLKEERRVRAHAKRLGLYEAIRERHSKGEYLTTIAHNLEIDYKTARRYALSDAQSHKRSPGYHHLPGGPRPLVSRWRRGPLLSGLDHPLYGAAYYGSADL